MFRSAGMEYLRADHEVRYRQALFDLLIKQYDAARLDEAKDAAIIQVVEPAFPPDRKSSPHRAFILLMFTLLGFLGACSYSFARTFVQNNPDIPRSMAQLKSALVSK